MKISPLILDRIFKWSFDIRYLIAFSLSHLYAAAPTPADYLLVPWSTSKEILFCHREISVFHHICLASQLVLCERPAMLIVQTFAQQKNKLWNERDAIYLMSFFIHRKIIEANLVSGSRFETSLSVISYFFFDVFNISACISNIFNFFVVSILFTCISVKAYRMWKKTHLRRIKLYETLTSHI